MSHHWQAGYQSDGQFCKECPEGKTCSRRGDVACEGMCAPGVQSQCDSETKFARCKEITCPTSTWDSDPTLTVTRGTYENPLTTECVTYVQCRVGFYKRFTPTGRTPSCLPCAAPYSPRYVFITNGLSPNDEASCLWECESVRLKTVFTAVVGSGWRWGTCELDGIRGPLPSHVSGWYGIPGSTQYPLKTCSPSHTSERNTARTAADCLACPALAANAVPMTPDRNCEWKCNEGWYKHGRKCMPNWNTGWLCRDEGFILTKTGQCVTNSIPWNRAGTRKQGTGRGAVTITLMAPGQVTLQPLPPFALSTGSATGGVGGRHWVLNGWDTVTIEGPMCSITKTWVGGYEYAIGAICDQSFLVHMNMSANTRMQRIQLLIGQPDVSGWADGFKSQAKFGRELHVTSGASNGTVWVLDRWNCVVREVSVWTTPGDYRTRVYTVHGSTDKLMGTAIPQPRCYGPDSLASPRRFWALADGDKVLFTDDNGLWQLELGTGALSLAMQETGGSDGTQFEADDLRTVTAPDRFTLLLEFLDGRVWEVTANSVACPDDSTSNAGGDCAVQCDWLEGGGSYVNGSSCVPCTVNGACGVGQEFVACTRSAQGRCRDCAAPAISNGRVYAVRGDCEASRMKYTPPCPVGHYALGAFCEPCPSELSTTTYPNATRVQQCKCKDGLRRSHTEAGEAGPCIGEDLFVYCVSAPEQCLVPPNATLAAGDGLGKCEWVCDTGHYRMRSMDRLADNCSLCERTQAESKKTAITRGDDDEPLSCEFN
jgi:hypothetical protein